MNYGKTLPYTGAAISFGALGFWTPVLIAIGVIVLGAVVIRLTKPIKR